MNLSSVFLGGIPSEQRKYLRVVLEHLKAKGYEKVHIPCTGQFTIVKAAIEAGFERKNIYSSDISLFSTVLGYLYSNQPLEEIDFEVIHPEYYEKYRDAESQIKKAAYVMFMMKLAQLRPSVYYERAFITEMIEREEHYINQLVEDLTKAKELYNGINYSIMDVRYLFEDDKGFGDDVLVIMNPPGFAKGYQKMFAFDGYMRYKSEVPEFDFNQEYYNLYEKSMAYDTPYLWYTSKDVTKSEIPRDQIIYAKENGLDKYSYWMINRPELLDDFPDKGLVVFKSNAKDIRHYEMLSKDHELTEKDQLNIVPINKETALYYRDLFAHRLGVTVAEIYFGVFVNGKLMSVCGFNTSFLRRLQEQYIFENFCFSISHDKYENLNRLAMMMLVSGDFYNYLVNEVLKNSAYVELKSFRTTCLTKYRKSKLNNRLLDLVHREKMENGTYKLIYEKEFYKGRSYADCLRLFLNDDVRIKKDHPDYVAPEPPQQAKKKPQPAAKAKTTKKRSVIKKDKK